MFVNVKLQKKMIFNTCLFLFGNIFFYTINALPYQRHRRQIISNTNGNLPYGGWGGGQNNPSGGSPGAYYGTGVNPNYGVIRPQQSVVDSNIHAMNSYNNFNSNSGSNSYLNQQQQQQQQYSSNNNNNNNRWQTSNMANNYGSNNRYPPGSQGWYATGGNYWYNNKGQSLIPHAGLFIISILISIICM